MRKYYSEPKLDVKKYSLVQTIYMDLSNPGDLDPDSNENGNDLNKDDNFDYFG